MQKRRVVHIVEALGGGVYSYFIELTQVLGPHPEIATTIIYSPSRQEIDPDQVVTDFHPAVELIALPMQRKLHPLKDWQTLNELTRLLGHLQPDILHLHSSKISVLGRLAKSRAHLDCRCYYSPHGYAFLRQDISGWKRAFYKQIEKWMAKHYGGITLACGDTEWAYAQEMGPALLIRNGVPIARVEQYRRSANTSGPLQIGILGRITEARDPAFFNTLAKRHPELEFIWIGDGHQRTILTSPNIKVTGWFMDREQAWECLSSLDVYLQISLWEGLPLAPLEAMAMHLPVIASRVIGNQDIVKHGETGYLCTSLNEFDQAIEKLKSPEHRRELGQQGRARVADFFDSTKNFKQLIELYLQTDAASDVQIGSSTAR
ncbi:glycosyltransferase [Croceiramulus getboli]|nr:glycosyltransferase [Flavobacteriaceae bacterium YJPT1-3]